MIIGILRLEISLYSMTTIKEKRNKIRSIKDIVRKNFNVAVSEITDNDQLGLNAELAIVGVSNDHNYLQATLSNVLNVLENHHSDIIVNHKLEFFSHF